MPSALKPREACPSDTPRNQYWRNSPCKLRKTASPSLLGPTRASASRSPASLARKGITFLSAHAIGPGPKCRGRTREQRFRRPLCANRFNQVGHNSGGGSRYRGAGGTAGYPDQQRWYTPMRMRDKSYADNSSLITDSPVLQSAPAWASIVPPDCALIEFLSCAIRISASSILICSSISRCCLKSAMLRELLIAAFLASRQ